jgi:flagellar motor switch protein FliN/FliY
MAAISALPVKEIRAVEPGAAAGLATIARQPVQALGRKMATIEQHPDWLLLARLPMRLSAGIPLPGFRVRNLLRLKVGQVVTSAWPSSGDVPLKVGQVHLSWSEFEVVEERMAIRLTRLV